MTDIYYGPKNPAPKGKRHPTVVEAAVKGDVYGYKWFGINKLPDWVSKINRIREKIKILEGKLEAERVHYSGLSGKVNKFKRKIDFAKTSEDKERQTEKKRAAVQQKNESVDLIQYYEKVIATKKATLQKIIDKPGKMDELLDSMKGGELRALRRYEQKTL